MRQLDLWCTNKRYKKCPRIDRKEILPLWGLGSYDGVASGIVLYQHKYYYAVAVSDITNPKWKGPNRRFFLVDVPMEKMTEAIDWMFRFEQHCGYHCTYNEDGTRGEQRHDFNRKWYREEFCARVKDYDGEVIGWFQSWRPT